MPVTADAPTGRIGFVHIPKCGGTSIEWALGIAKDYPAIGLKATKTVPDNRLLFGGGLQHLTAREFVRNHTKLWKSLRFSFSVVRDPLERLISHFFWVESRFKASEATNDLLLPKFGRLLETIEALADSTRSFRDFADGLEFQETAPDTFGLNDVTRHVIPQCSFLFCFGEIPVNYVFLLDDMDKLQSFLSEQGALQSNFERRMARQSHKKFSNQIPDHLRERVRKLYDQDYRLIRVVRSGSDRSLHGAAEGSAIAAEFNEPYQLQECSSSRRAGRARIDAPCLRDRVPRKIWMYWNQGWKDTPLIVGTCRASWQNLNRSWSMNLLTDENLEEHVELPRFYKSIRRDLTTTAFSDVLRIHLLRIHGGVWADATTFCVRPLDEWIDDCTSSAGFFAYSKPGRNRPIASWFLAAHAGSQIVASYSQAVDNLWRAFVSGRYSALQRLFADDVVDRQKLLSDRHSFSFDLLNLISRSRQPHRLVNEPVLTDEPSSPYYFWFHRIFQTLLETDRQFAQAWSKAPQITARPPHKLRTRLFEPLSSEDEMHISNRTTNVYKLDRRLKIPGDLTGTSFDFLVRTLIREET